MMMLSSFSTDHAPLSSTFLSHQQASNIVNEHCTFLSVLAANRQREKKELKELKMVSSNSVLLNCSF